ncbi:hypothetical protein DDP54_15530 (plasmid) [Cellulomonas sp. WB94]|uniref:hypothetical protein n=1 Tax=Cellulomonas sp. WB94 TaxID=2173174 RepID=UPI000D57B9B9|nr:hypothetical protein [Cellulomonas sp. WB94]PVU81313.1 hypothetical protein DDP54_15530 [Cellulomonas sp. WB94]
MGEYIDDEQLGVDQEGDTDLVKQLRHQIKSLGTELHQTKAERDQLKTAGRTTTITQLLDEHKITNAAKVAKLIPADVEATKGGIDAWLGEFGDVFGIQKQATPTGETPAAGTEQAPAVPGQPTLIPSDVQAQWSAVQAAEQQAQVIAPVGLDRTIQELEALRGKGFEAVQEYMRTH